MTEVGSTDKGGSSTVSTPSTTAPAASTTPSSTPAAAPSAAASLAKVAAAGQPDSSSGAPGQVVEAGKSGAPGVTGPVDTAASQVPNNPNAEPANYWDGIPESRKAAILRNTEEKVRKEVEAQFAWAKGLDQGRVSSAMQLAQHMASDPAGFIRQLVHEARSDAQLSQALADVLGDSSPKQPWSMPEPALLSEDGKRKAYSAEQVQEIVSHAIEEIRGEIGPLQGHLGEIRQREQFAQTIHDARTESANVMTEMRNHPAWPKGTPEEVKAEEAKIADALKSIPEATRQRIGAVGSLQLAFNNYLTSHVLPRAQQTAEQKVQDDLKRRATAGQGGVVPGGSIPASKSPIRNVDDLAKRMKEMAGSAA